MAAFQKRAGSWRALVRMHGTSESRTFATKAQAVAWATELEKRLEGARTTGVQRGHSLAAALRRYAEEVSPTKRGVRWELLRLEALAATLPAKPVDELTADDIGRWRDARLAGADGRRAVRSSTVNRELNLLGAALERARVEWKWLKANPARDVRRPTNPPHRRRVISTDERNRLLLALGYSDELPVTTLSQQVAVVLLLALESGMRAGEITGLTWDAVHDRYVSLPLTKNGDPRDVPLSHRARVLIEKMRGTDEHRVFTVSDASRDALFRKARDRCRLHGLTFHDSRHTAVTRMAKLPGMDVLKLAKIIGHRDPKSLMIYFNPTADELAELLG